VVPLGLRHTSEPLSGRRLGGYFSVEMTIDFWTCPCGVSAVAITGPV
jgi:hypothetical protein